MDLSSLIPNHIFAYPVEIKANFADIVDWIRGNIPAHPDTMCGVICRLESPFKFDSTEIFVFEEETESVVAMKRRYLHEYGNWFDGRVTCKIAFVDPQDELMFKLKWV